MMQRVQMKMLVNVRGHDEDDDGVKLPAKHYEKDQVYPVGPSLAKTMRDHKLAVQLTEGDDAEKAEKEADKKEVGKKPKGSKSENKMLDGAKGK